MKTSTGTRTRARGFTIMEILVSILVIFILMGLIIVGARHVRKLARGSADRAMVTSLVQGVSLFSSEFKFLPPLVKDFEAAGPTEVVGGRRRPRIYSTSPGPDATTLRTSADHPALETTPQVIHDDRFSLYSLPYFIIGGLEMEAVAGEGKPIDGVPGPGFLTPKRDGTFERSGRKFDSFFDLGRSGTVLFSPDATQGRVIVRDANGIPIRYYRWLRGDLANNNQIVDPDRDCNVPLLLGKPSENPDLKSADFAIVAAGPDGVFGDEADLLTILNFGPTHQPLTLSWSDLASKVGLNDPAGDGNLEQRIRNKARKDNIVEVGRAK